MKKILLVSSLLSIFLVGALMPVVAQQPDAENRASPGMDIMDPNGMKMHGEGMTMGRGQMTMPGMMGRDT
jgi:hypothetical protein